MCIKNGIDKRPLVLVEKDYFCVCVMFHDGFPVSLESVMEQMKEAEDDPTRE